MLAFFDVISWGEGAYVYLHVTAPSGHEIQKFEAQTEGRVDFIASEDGEHSFCFKNAYSETEISFWINTETDSVLADVAKEGMNSQYFARRALRFTGCRIVERDTMTMKVIAFFSRIPYFVHILLNSHIE